SRFQRKEAFLPQRKCLECGDELALAFSPSELIAPSRTAFACLRTGMSGRRPVAIAPIPLRASSFTASIRRARVIISATYLGLIVVLPSFPPCIVGSWQLLSSVTQSCTARKTLDLFGDEKLFISTTRAEVAASKIGA